MKALILERYNKLAYKDVDDPKMLPGEVLIEVKACGICGSDVHGMDGSTGRRHPPLIMGHEASGIIVECSPQVSHWRPGDRVTFDSTIYPLNDWYTLKGLYNLSDNRQVMGVSPGDFTRHGAFAQYVAVPQHILYRIPDKVSFEEAAMVEPVSVALHALRLGKPQAGETALVVGAGMIGIFIIKALALSGLSNLIAIDKAPEKRKQAEAMGADLSFDPEDAEGMNKLQTMSQRRGADLAFEAVGVSQTVNMAIDVLRKGGRCVLVGNVTPEINFPLQKVVTRELSILGSCAICGEYEAALNLIAKGKISVKDQLSAVAPLSEGAEWFARLKQKNNGLNKVILVP